MCVHKKVSLHSSKTLCSVWDCNQGLIKTRADDHLFWIVEKTVKVNLDLFSQDIF